VYDIRLMVEPTLAARAASVRDPELARALTALCDPAIIDGLVGDPAHEDDLGRHDVAFHRLIAHHAGNRMAAEALRSVLTRGVRYSMYYSATAAQLAWDEHRAIATAICAGNQADAAEAMRDHLVKALDRYRSNFR
jgi:DNA-binding FadR family transcriptional regulator